MDLTSLGRNYWGGLLAVVALGSAGLAFIFFKFPRQNWQAFLEIHPVYLFLAFFLTGGLWLVETSRMQLILKSLGWSLPWKNILAVNLAFAFAAAVTPAGSGGPPVQAYLLYRQGLKAEKAVVAATTRMALSLIFFALINPVLVIFFQSHLGLAGWLSWLVLTGVTINSLGMLVFFLLTLRPAWVETFVGTFLPLRFRAGFRRRVEDFSLAWRELFKSKNYLRLILIFILTLFYWGIFFSLGWILALGLGALGAWLPFVARMILIYFLLSYVPLPGASGAAEVSYAYVFSDYVSRDLAGALVTGWRFFTYYINIIVGSLALWWLIKSEPDKER